MKHARHLDIDAVDRLAGDLVDDVEPFLARADQRPVLGILEGHALGRLAARGRGGDLAERDLALARHVGDDPVLRGAFGGRHVPVRGRGGDQHRSRRGAGLAQIILRGADRAAAAGRHVAPYAVATEILLRRCVLGADLLPVALQLFGDQHRERRERALAHLGAGDADHDGVVGPDHDPGRDLGRTIGCAHHGGAAEGDIEADCETGAKSGGADDEGTAIHSGRNMLVHVAAP